MKKGKGIEKSLSPAPVQLTDGITQAGV